MKPCVNCGLDAVNPEDPARYDVFAEDITGPYCPECWPLTYTYGVTHE